MAGFYEWKPTGTGSSKTPYFIHPKEQGETFWAAGLWEPRADDPDRSPQGSFTIITTGAQDAFCEVHDRMPVFLPSEHVDEWLKADVGVGMEILLAAPVPKVELRQVSTRVNSVRADDSSLLDPVIQG